MNSHTSSAHGDPQRDATGVALWVAQIVLFMVFAATGIAKVAVPIERLAPLMAWVTDMPPTVVRLIGVAELLGALGVLLPTVTRVHPKLSSLAALGLAIVMVLAVPVHLVAGELTRALVPFAIGALAAFVALGRYALVPVVPRKLGGRASTGRFGGSA